MNTIAGVLGGLLGCLSVQAIAEEGLVKIDQAAVRAAGGFPYQISQPGSYRLTSNLLVPATANGIMVNASNVELDLNGFTITCAGNQFAAITEDPVTPTDALNVKIRHGAVTGCGMAVYLSATGVDIDDLTVSNYTQVGIELRIGSLRRSTLNGGGVANSLGLYIQSGIVESNHLSGDSFGISGGNSSLLLTGNVIQASKAALIINSNETLYGNNVLFAPSTGTEARSQGNNLCNLNPC